MSLSQRASFESSGHFPVNEVTVKFKKSKYSWEKREVLFPSDHCHSAVIIRIVDYSLSSGLAVFRLFLISRISLQWPSDDGR